jgi:lysine 6-dehydrogenase
MSFRYLLLGAGRQGIAGAYDLGRFGEAESILVADVIEAAAAHGAKRLNTLLGREVATPLRLDAARADEVRTAMRDVHACLNSVHYALNVELTRLAIDAGVHMTDLGGNTAVVREQLEMNDAARRKGVAIVPDCGMGPGLNISLATYVMDLLDETDDVRIWDGGLPQHPETPWNYALTFNIAGLTNEYDGCATFLRDGRLTAVPCFEDVEPIEFPGLGPLEAFVTSGGLSTAPWTFQGKLRRLENKTVRYPGHAAMFKAFVALGLLDMDPVQVGQVQVAPREVLHALLEPKIKRDIVKDICVMRVRADGRKDGRPASATVELVDRYDEATGFTAMQRLTGWHASIMLIAAVTGQIAPGVTSVERALPGVAVVDEVRRRGFNLRTDVTAAPAAVLPRPQRP